MTGNVLVLKGMSRYNVLRVAADEMIDAFKKLGFDVTVADLNTDSQELLVKVVTAAFEKSYDLIFSFQALFFELRLFEGEDSYLNSLNTPVFGHIVDHPIYHNNRIVSKQGNNMYLGCIDRNHKKYVEKYYPHIENAVYFPHAGFMGKNNVSYENRTIDLYFPSSYTNPTDELNNIETLPEVYKNMAYLFIKKMLENPLHTLQGTLLDYLNQINFTHTSEEFTELMNLFAVVDQYVRSITRDDLIRCLLDNDITVTVSGDGWHKFISSYDNLTIISTEGLDITDTLDIMGNSKMVLNHIPTYQDGMHERIYTSMLCGAICLTNDFPCVHEEFNDGENILLYSKDKLQTFAENVKLLLTSPTIASEIASKGNLIANTSHTWFHNAQKILKIVGIN